MNAVVSKLKQIKKYCREHDDYCTNCVYRVAGPDTYGCLIMDCVHYLEGTPDDWNLEFLEEELK